MGLEFKTELGKDRFGGFGSYMLMKMILMEMVETYLYQKFYIL